MIHNTFSDKHDDTLTSLVAELVSHLEEFHPDCWDEIQSRTNTLFKRKLNTDFALSIVNLFNPLALLKKHKFPKCRPEDYWMNAQRNSIREFIDQQNVSIESYEFTDKEKIFLGYKTCDIIHLTQQQERTMKDKLTNIFYGAIAPIIFHTSRTSYPRDHVRTRTVRFWF